MRGVGRWLGPALVYSLWAIWLIGPGFSSPTDSVPGGSRTDLWNGLWSLDFARDALLSGQAPWNVDVLAYRGPLGESGGFLPPVDPLGVLCFVPLGLLGLPLGYNLLILIRLVAGGLLAKAFVEELAAHHGADKAQARRGGFLAGLAVTGTPMLIAGVHNGTSEAANASGLIVALWMGWRFGQSPSARRAMGFSLGLVWAAFNSWYAAVLAFFYAGLVVLFRARSWPVWRRSLPLWGGLVLLAPWLIGVVFSLEAGSTNLTNHQLGARLVETSSEAVIQPGIEGTPEYLTLESWLSPTLARDGAIHSPSEKGEGFFHTGHVAWVLLVIGILGLRRMGRKEAPLMGLALASVLLSFGSALEVGGLSIWMPLAGLKELPGFSQLWLPFRFGLAAALVLAIAAGVWTALRSSRWVWIVGALAVLQLRFYSPIATGVPKATLEGSDSVLMALQDAPEGAVLHVPIVGQQPTPYAQRVHGKPVTAGLNWANSELVQAFWQVARDSLAEPDLSAFQASVKELGIRYVVVHRGDPKMRADSMWTVYRTIRDRFDALEGSGGASGYEVYALW